MQPRIEVQKLISIIQYSLKKRTGWEGREIYKLRIFPKRKSFITIPIFKWFPEVFKLHYYRSKAKKFLVTHNLKNLNNGACKPRFITN